MSARKTDVPFHGVIEMSVEIPGASAATPGIDRDRCNAAYIVANYAAMQHN